MRKKLSESEKESYRSLFLSHMLSLSDLVELRRKAESEEDEEGVEYIEELLAEMEEASKEGPILLIG